jgi:hypothetical protein
MSGRRRRGVATEKRISLDLEPFESRVLLDGAPELAAGVYIYEGSSPISVTWGDSAPSVVDWNNDGRKDLLVGQEYNGHINLYVNVGTDTDPVFTGSSLVEASGTPITTSYG